MTRYNLLPSNSWASPESLSEATVHENSTGCTRACSCLSAFFSSEKYSISYLILILIILFKMRPNHKAPDQRVRESMQSITERIRQVHNEGGKQSVRELL